MEQNGRKSAKSLEVVAPVSRMPRPIAPTELSEEQAREWSLVVERLPADWFPAETHGLLAQYCRHIVSARRVAQLIASLESGEDFSIAAYDKLLAMQEREGRAMSSLATRMRISQQSTFDKEKRKPLKMRKPPWEDG